jgi:hypothetical protein
MSLAASSRARDYLLSLSGVTDFLSMMPIIMFIVPIKHRNDVIATVGLLRFFRLLNIYHSVMLQRSLGTNGQPYENAVAQELSEISFQVTRLVVTITIFVFLSTSIVFAISYYNPHSFTEASMGWYECFYFVTITGN